MKLAEVGDLSDGAGMEVEHAGRIIAIFRVGDAFFAIDGMCSHQGGPLADGVLDRCVVACPWHGWKFDVRDGRCLTGRAPAQQVYDVRVEGRDILVDVP